MSTLPVESLRSLCLECYEVGSRVTCNPPVLNTDHDWLILTGDLRAFIVAAVHEGFLLSGSVPADELEQRKEVTQFTSLKRDIDTINLIVTDSPEFAKRFMAATSVAKLLNLQGKDDRIRLFQAVLYGNPCQ